MAEASVESDMSIGIGLALAFVTLLGAVAMGVGPTQLSRAWGFAGAMIAGLLAVVAVQAYA